jgi:cytochrome b561
MHLKPLIRDTPNIKVFVFHWVFAVVYLGGSVLEEIMKQIKKKHNLYDLFDDDYFFLRLYV